MCLCHFTILRQTVSNIHFPKTKASSQSFSEIYQNLAQLATASHTNLFFIVWADPVRNLTLTTCHPGLSTFIDTSHIVIVVNFAQVKIYRKNLTKKAKSQLPVVWISPIPSSAQGKPDYILEK